MLLLLLLIFTCEMFFVSFPSPASLSLDPWYIRWGDCFICIAICICYLFICYCYLMIVLSGASDEMIVLFVLLFVLKPCCVKWGNGIISILLHVVCHRLSAIINMIKKIVTSAPGLPSLLTQHSPIHISITYTSSMCALSQWSLIIHQGIILHLWSRTPITDATITVTGRCPWEENLQKKFPSTDKVLKYTTPKVMFRIELPMQTLAYHGTASAGLPLLLLLLVEHPLRVPRGGDRQLRGGMAAVIRGWPSGQGRWPVTDFF